VTRPTNSERPAPVQIGAHKVGPGHPAYIVAELSGNHNGSLQRALDTVKAAADSGADAIKLQTYTADTMTIRSSDPAFVLQGDGPWSGRTLHDLYQEAHTPWEWHEPLFKEANRCGIEIFSTPFDATAVDFLQKLGVPAIKVASFEMTDDPLLRAIAQTGKPVVVSTGMASLEEITHAQAVLNAAGSSDLVFLRCTSSYPAPDNGMRLASIPVLESTVRSPVGLSDHSMGATAAIVAVTLGACLIEKHLTLSRADGGVDSHFSAEPREFASMVNEVRRAEAMASESGFGLGVAEEGMVIYRRSLYVVRDVAAGERFTPETVRSIRPGYGLPPRFLDLVLTARARRDIAAGTPLSWVDILD
jgi:pseudaminic acid synthase